MRHKEIDRLRLRPAGLPSLRLRPEAAFDGPL